MTSRRHAPAWTRTCADAGHTLATFGGDTVEYYYLKAFSYLTTGERDLARAYADSGHAIEGPMRLMILAEVYAICGENDTAIDVLERLLSIPSATSATQLKLDPIWDPLRDNPRFQDLLERFAGW